MLAKPSPVDSDLLYSEHLDKKKFFNERRNGIKLYELR